MKVGKKLALARKYLGLSQESVAKILHITIEEVEKYETKYFIKSTKLKPFLKLYGITKEDLYNNDKNIKDFDELSEHDKKEVIKLFKLLKDIKKRR